MEAVGQAGGANCHRSAFRQPLGSGFPHPLRRTRPAIAWAADEREQSVGSLGVAPEECSGVLRGQAEGARDRTQLLSLKELKNSFIGGSVHQPMLATIDFPIGCFYNRVIRAGGGA